MIMPLITDYLDRLSDRKLTVLSHSLYVLGLIAVSVNSLWLSQYIPDIGVTEVLLLMMSNWLFFSPFLLLIRMVDHTLARRWFTQSDKYEFDDDVLR